MKQIVVLAIAVGVLFASCGQRGDNIDLSKSSLRVEVKRFDSTLFSIPVDSLDVAVAGLQSEYGTFFNLFTEGVIGIGTPENQDFAPLLKSFVSHSMVRETYGEVQRLFPNTNELNQQLTNAFKRYQYYFPGAYVPQIYGFVSGFNNSIVLADSCVGIGFDRYLGRESVYYPQLGIARYLINNMHPKKIPSDCIRAWAIGTFAFNDSINNLVSHMVYEGMLMHFTKRLLPAEPDSLIFGFTQQQMDWCYGNESQMWTTLVEQKLLFDTNAFTITKHIKEAPFTHSFSQDSPGRAAVWLGYRIVQAYVEANPDVTLKELMNITDYQSILNKSKYRPS